MRGAASQISAGKPSRAKIGQIHSPAHLTDEISLTHRADAVAQVSTITVATATNSYKYTVTVADEPISFTSDASATKAEIADGLADAMNANSLSRGIGIAVTAGVDENTYTVGTHGLSVDVATAEAKLTLATATAASDGSSIPFGVFVFHDGAGGIQAANAGTAKSLTLAVDTVANASEYALTLWYEGASHTVAYTSDASATEAEISGGLKTAIDLLGLEMLTTSVDGSDDLVIAGTVAGFTDFGITAQDARQSLTEVAGSDLSEVVACLTAFAYDEEATAVASNDTAFPSKQLVRGVAKGRVYVANGASASKSGRVYIGQSTAERGQAFTSNDGSGGRLPLPRAAAEWFGADIVLVKLPQGL